MKNQQNKVTRYQIVETVDIPTLIMSVNALLAKGYKLQGGVQITPQAIKPYVQALTHEEDQQEVINE